jgi:hypothetical protein
MPVSGNRKLGCDVGSESEGSSESSGRVDEERLTELDSLLRLLRFIASRGVWRRRDARLYVTRKH